jgi:hypothetical protein
VRSAVLLGRRRLVPAAKPEPETLAKHFNRASKEERLAAAHEIGAGLIGESLIEPC